LFAAIISATEPTELKAKITVVTDGDTITALDKNSVQAKLRLHGIDAPESGQAFSTKAKEFTSALCFEKTVEIKIVDTDQYGSYVAIVTLPDGKILNDALVRNGMAWWYEQQAPKDAILKTCQESAKAEKLGLWADSDPVPPWEFRKNEAEKKEQASPSVPEHQPAFQTPQDGEVYIAPTGKKYHNQGCRTLRNGSTGVSLSAAQSRGYEACKVCGGR
ncbi:MAG: thermonuclease family protein, partial [Fimbriimonadaceae bacterium]